MPGASATSTAPAQEEDADLLGFAPVSATTTTTTTATVTTPTTTSFAFLSVQPPKPDVYAAWEQRVARLQREDSDLKQAFRALSLSLANPEPATRFLHRFLDASTEFRSARRELELAVPSSPELAPLLLRLDAPAQGDFFA